MKLVIEVPEDFEDDEAQLRYLRRMQDESDLAAQESPEDHWPGFGTMNIGTTHMRSDAKILGVLHHETDENTWNLKDSGYIIEPLPEVK